MAVYTVLDREEIEAYIAPFGIGPLVNYKGIAEGITNTNYLITTDQSEFGSELQTEPLHQFVLTLFEAQNLDDLQFYTKLTTLLNLKGLPVPCPERDSDGVSLKYLQGKPALLIPKVPGLHQMQPNPAQCQELGATLANIHRACMDANLQHQGPRSVEWLVAAAAELNPHLEDADQKLLNDEISHFVNLHNSNLNLPRCVIHGDVFRDNALFVGGRLAGIINFFSASDGYLIYDLAVVANDWCSQHDGSLNHDNCDALLAGYEKNRPLSDDEKSVWNDFLRIAAVRFWVTRLLIKLDPGEHHRPGGLMEIKDPQEYKNILMQRLYPSDD
ncbi:homoserine kinase [Dasania marina]|uniref:homoserine kinase n=1 Tax=Dasania marina TaxID=471499 RepID=UPI00036A60DE|nr:homoserine kinase [Dasania marina]